MLDNESVSLVLQDVVECDSVFQTGYVRKFVEAACRDPVSVLKQWKGKSASHLWDIVVQKVCILNVCFKWDVGLNSLQ